MANGQPLPPIPDGGLARAMPGWLRDAPFANATSPAKDESDPAAFLSEEDLPPWLRHLASGAPPPASPAPGSPATRPAPPETAPAMTVAHASGRPTTAESAATQPLAPPAAPPIRRVPRPDTATSETEPRPATPVPETEPAASDRSLLLTLAVLIVLAIVIYAVLKARGVI